MPESPGLESSLSEANIADEVHTIFSDTQLQTFGDSLEVQMQVAANIVIPLAGFAPGPDNHVSLRQLSRTVYQIALDFNPTFKIEDMVSALVDKGFLVEVEASEDKTEQSYYVPEFVIQHGNRLAHTLR